MELSQLQERVYSTLNKTPNKDVSITVLYKEVYAPSRILRGNLPVRNMQQRLGSIIARINTKLGPERRIEPGRLKQTYRLNTKVK